MIDNQSEFEHSIVMICCCALEWMLLFGGLVFGVVSSFLSIFISIVIHRRISDFQYLLTMEYINFFSMFSWLYFFVFYVHVSSRNQFFVSIIRFVCKIAIWFVSIYQILLALRISLNMEYFSWLFISLIIGYVNKRLYKYILNGYRDDDNDDGNSDRNDKIDRKKEK